MQLEPTKHPDRKPGTRKFVNLVNQDGQPLNQIIIHAHAGSRCLLTHQTWRWDTKSRVRGFLTSLCYCVHVLQLTDLP
jgi:hypothetical protein